MSYALAAGAHRLQTLKLQLWFENADGEGFGGGRIRLLKLIDELGSLSKAAHALDMSYRGAWGKLKKAEAVLGVPLVEAVGAKRDGCRLSAHGKALVAAYETLYADTLAYADRRAAELFNAEEQ